MCAEAFCYQDEIPMSGLKGRFEAYWAKSRKQAKKKVFSYQRTNEEEWPDRSTPLEVL